MPTPAASIPPRPRSWIGKFFANLGPGVVTGAADDDPSGIATYSVAGAQVGTGLLWTALFTWPLIAVIQMTCSRIGMVTGAGLGASLRAKFPRPVLVVAGGALLAANAINIGADLSAMADAVTVLTGLNAHLLVAVFGLAIAWATVRFSYARLAMTLKWLALALTAYIFTALICHPDWGRVAHDTFRPSLPQGKAEWSTLVAILGTTISPYLFFWQASQEVEEEKALGRKGVGARRGASREELGARRIDVGVGTFFAVVVMFFIMLTTALTLHRHGITRIETTRQAAEALRPLAGNLATTLYAVGLLGVGFLAIPTLAGSAAYAFAETFQWRQGLDRRFHQARAFYGVIVVSIGIGIVLNLMPINPIQALYWSAVVNGLVAPFLLVGIFIVARDRKLMRNLPASRLSLTIVALAAALMFVAGAAMFLV